MAAVITNFTRRCRCVDKITDKHKHSLMSIFINKGLNSRVARGLIFSNAATANPAGAACCWTVHDTGKYTTQPFNGPLSGTLQVGQYQKKHSPTHTNPDHQISFLNFLNLLWSTESSMYNLCAWQSFSITSLQVFFGVPLEPSTLYSIHFFTQSLSSFCNTCPYHRNLFLL